MAIRIYGLRVPDLSSGSDIDNSSAIVIHTQPNTNDNYGVLFRGSGGDKFNAISWGDPFNELGGGVVAVKSLYIKSNGTVYKNVSGVETAIEANINSLGGVVDIVAGEGITITSGGTEVEVASKSPIFATDFDKTVANTTDETTLLGANTSGSLTIPADYIQPGAVIRITAKGVISTDAVVPPDITFKTYLGAVEVASTAASTIGIGFTNGLWEMQADITCRSDGETGAFEGYGSVMLPVSSASTAIRAFPIKTASVVDTTADNTLNLTVDWSAADSDNSITLESFVAEIMDPGAGL